MCAFFDLSCIWIANNEMADSIDLEGVKNAISESNRITTSLSPNRLVKNQAQEMEKDLYPEYETNGSSNISATSYNNESFFTSFNNLFKALISPASSVATHTTFFKPREKLTYSRLVEFYIYHFVLTMIYLVMTFIRAFQFVSNKTKLKFLSLAYNPAEDPEVINHDINKLAKIPRRVSVILNYKPEQEENGGVEGLCNDVSKISTWCLSSGISYLSVYEYHGVLKKRVPELRRAVFKKFTAYFGTENVPNFVIKIPHLNLSYPGSIDGKLIEDEAYIKELDLSGTKPTYDIEITLLSMVDGRPTIVELTKVMADLAKRGDLKAHNITLKFVDQELQQLVGKEPDLVIMFQPFLNLQGYPPWQIRLSELYWEPDNDSIGYAVFLRALQKYSTCKINVGR